MTADTREKSARALKTISEVSEILELPQHVLRFWETKFPQIQPLKRRGGRRFYRPQDIELLKIIKTLLHEKGYTIKGAVAELNQAFKPRLELVKHVDTGSEPLLRGNRQLTEEDRQDLQAVRRELLEIRELLRKAG